jgi:DNA-binding SARP family transcriptional activator/Tfp pilus assembly protein PilF
MGSDLDFGVLGPLELTRDGEPILVNGPKLRVVLAALLLRANATVSIDRLVEHLWGAAPPATARKNAQLYVLRLRRILDDENIIETRSDGYALRLRPEQLDLLRFRQLIRAAQDARDTGDPAAELDLLVDALRCWRGTAIDDIPSESLQQEYVAQLAEERLQARERYLEVCLELGRHREIIGLLGQLTRENPWQESFWELLLLALHRSGRLADALETYRTVHRMFTDELGVEPGRRLRQIHQTLLAAPADAAQPTGHAVPLVGQLPADLPSFSGRSEDLAALDAFLAPDRAPAHRVLAVVGPGGIGKTALAVHWAHRVRDQFPDGQLFVDLRGYASTSPVSSTQALTLCLLALGVPARHVPATVEEQIVSYRASLAGRRVLVVLDNAADADQVRPLLPSSPGCVVLVTSRGDLRGLTVLNDARVRGLDVLTTSDARDLLAELLGADMAMAEPAAVDQLAELCGHLPLALRIAAANLVGGKHALVSEYAAALRNDRLAELAIVGDPGVAVRATFHLSYAALDERTRRVFRLLGRVPGPDFTMAAASAVTGMAEATRSSLDLLVSASLLTRRTSRRYQFHDLVREYAAACACADEPAADLAAADTRLFEHYRRTADAAAASLFPAVRRLVSADRGDHPVRFDDKEAALRWLDDERVNLVAAVERGAAASDLRHYCGLLADALRGYFAIRGYAADGLALSTAALTAARAAGDRRAEVAVLVLRGLIYYNLSDYEQATTQLGVALEVNRHAPDPLAEAECLYNLGRVYSQLGRPRDAMRHHKQALAIAREIGDEATEAREINYVGVALLSLGQIDEATACHQEALEISRRIGDRSIRTPALNGLGLAHWTAGRLVEAVECHKECVEANDRDGLRHQATAALVCLAETYCDLGRYQEAETCAREALERGQQLGERRHEAGSLEVLATVQRRQGRLAESVQGYTAALRLARKINFRYGEVSVLIGLATAHRESGRPADAITHVELALAKMNETGMRVLECAAFIELAADHLALSDLAMVARHAGHALDIAREDGQRLNEARARRVLGLLHDTRGESDAARVSWQTALEILSDIGAPEAAEVSRLLHGTLALAGGRQPVGALGPDTQADRCARPGDGVPANAMKPR